MSTPNPYAPPVAEVQEARPEHDDAEDQLIPGGRTVPAGHGLSWFGGAWRLFKTQWLMWWLVLLLTLGAVIVVTFIPVVNLIAFVGFPLIAAGLGSCARSTLREGRFEVAQLFDGFRHNTVQLLLIGVIYLALIMGTVAVLALAFGASGLFGLLFGGGDPMVSGTAMAGLGVGFFIVYLLAIMLIGTSVVFAPYLVFEHNMSAIEAMKMSVTGSLRNILAGIVATLSYFVLAILATIPLLLGWLVLFPVLMLTVYVAYRDIYVESPLQA